MGRRALRTIDPTLDLVPYLIEADQLPESLRVTDLFRRSAPLEVEVGSGKGLFLATAAASLPDHDFLGIEISRRYARFSAARLARAESDNARVVHGDAKRLFALHIPDASLRAVHIYFPDPWWKKRHHKRRVISESFVQDIQRVIAPGGQLHFWTDVQEYFQASVELISSQQVLVGPHDVQQAVAQHDLDYRTHFERRMRLQQISVYRARFDKPSGGASEMGRE